MRNNFSYLNDEQFLTKLFARKVKHHYAKILLLDFKTENLYKEFVGRVTAGTVTLSASSAIRRTCSLTVAAEESENDLTNIDGDISVNKKFQLFVGYENDLSDSWIDIKGEEKTYQDKYGDIIWFPLGVFIFTGVSISRTSSGSNISITGKDKMCLLNGEIAGEIPGNTTFSEKYTYLEDGSIQVEYPTIFEIIQESVNHLGGEDLTNIVIGDIPSQIKHSISYNGTRPLYYGTDNAGKKLFSINEDDIYFLIKKYQTNDIVGYIYEDFVWPGETLIQSAGSSIGTLLSTISNKLGNYEYFYSKEGIFFFQEIKNYLNTSYTPITKVDNENYVVNFSESTKSVYTFDESELALNYTNTPNYANIKNDICVWGEGENNTAIFYHVAIDKKPEIQEHKVVFYKENDKTLVKAYSQNYELKEGEYIQTIQPADWRYELYLRDLELAVLGLEKSYYYSELVAFFPLIYDFENNCFIEELINNPEQLVYWLDFISPDSTVGQFSVDNIGRRTKAITDNNLHSIYTRDIEDVIIYNEADIFDDNGFQDKVLEMDMYGQDYVVVDENLYTFFTTTSTSSTCYDKARDLLQQYTYYNESITINSMPIYYLEPNTRITVNNKATGIEGDFIIQTINLPLAASGQMTLTATRATTKV